MNSKEKDRDMSNDKSQVCEAKSLRALAERIYDLDRETYITLGSRLGRVYTEDRDRCVKDILMHMIDPADNHVLRSELALIGNMARTVRDRKKRRELMTEYDEVLIAERQTQNSCTIFGSIEEKKEHFILGDRFGKDNRLIICIGRTYGSGGNHIGFSIADALKINYYDAEIFHSVLGRLEASEDAHNISDVGSFESYLEIDRKNPGLSYQKEKSSLIKKLKRINRYHGLPARDAVFFNQSDLILNMAEKEDFVVMGRCADVILKNNNIPHISIFITAPIEFRAKRMMEINHVDYKKALRQLKEVDHAHAAYYHFYTGRKWGDANNYDLCINSAGYGIDGSVDFIMNLLETNGIMPR